MTFGENLRKVRKQKKITQQELADIVGRDRSLISVYELDKSVPNVYFAKDLANALGVPLDEIVGEPNWIGGYENG